VGVRQFSGQARHRERVSGGSEVLVDLAGDVTLEDPDDLGFGSSLGEPAGDVCAGAFVAAHTGEHDAPERMVGVAVPAAVEPMADGLAGGCFDGGDTAQVRERGFVAQPVRVVARGDQKIAAVSISTPSSATSWARSRARASRADGRCVRWSRRGRARVGRGSVTRAWSRA
jgi:hypothetical protein